MATNRFQLVFDPGSTDEEQIPFTISEDDIDDAISYGRVERDEPFEKQISGAAYHKVMQLNVTDDVRNFESAWVVLQNKKIIARNVGAVDVAEEDLD